MTFLVEIVLAFIGLFYGAFWVDFVLLSLFYGFPRALYWRVKGWTRRGWGRYLASAGFWAGIVTVIYYLFSWWAPSLFDRVFQSDAFNLGRLGGVAFGVGRQLLSSTARAERRACFIQWMTPYLTEGGLTQASMMGCERFVDHSEKIESHTYISAAETAEKLFSIMVEEEPDPVLPEKFGLPTTIWPEFKAKMRHYREATVLMLLLSETQKDPKYEEVLKAYEGLIFPATPTPDGMTKLDTMKGTMQRIRDLINPRGDRKELTWSKAWLNEVGHTETNPATLTLFALYWMDYHIAVSRALSDLSPDLAKVVA